MRPIAATGLGRLLLPAAAGLFSTWIKPSVQFPAQPTQICALTREVAETGQAKLYMDNMLVIHRSA